MARPFRVLGLQQVALGSRSHDALLELWGNLLGLPVTGRYRSEPENVDELILALGRGDQVVELDLMQPVDPAKKPTVHEPALHHIGIWVSDLPAAVAWLSERGVHFAPGGIRKGATGHDVCFIHPRPSSEHPLSGQGVLIELVQAPKPVEAP
jgi:lactoylglutathione lyase